MPFVLGLNHLGLLGPDLLGLLLEPLLGRLQRLVAFLLLALLMPVGSDNLLAAIVGIERTMGNHALEAIFLNLTALSVHCRPLRCRQGGLDLWCSPVHQGLPLRGLHHDKLPGIIWSRDLPRPALD